MKSHLRNSFHVYFVPTLILLFAFFVRFIYISAGPYHLDCLTLAIKASETLETHRLQYMFGSGYPLTVILGSLFLFGFKQFGVHDPVYAVNFMSVVFGALGCWVFFLWIRALSSTFAALAGAVFFCFSPILWGTSVYGMSHSPSLFFLLTSLYFLFRFLNDFQKVFLFQAAIFLGLMGAARIQDMVVMMVPLSYLFFVDSSGNFERKNFSQQLVLWTQFIFVAGIIAVTFHLPFIWDRFQSDYHEQWKSYWYLGMSSNFKGFFSEFLVLSGAFLRTNYTDFGLLLGLWGWGLLFLNQKRFAVFLILWFAIFLFFWGNLSTVVPRFFVVMIPALIVGQCHGLAMFFEKSKISRWISMGLLIVFLFAQAQVMLPVLIYRHTTSAIRDFSVWVGQITESNARVVGGDERFFIAYYGKRKAQGRPSCAVVCSDAELENFRQDVDSWLKNGEPVYITNTALLADNPKGEFASFIQKHYQKLFVGQHLSEDWHQDGFGFRVGYEKLFRLYPKQ